jgi:hypothetical protein
MKIFEDCITHHTGETVTLGAHVSIPVDQLPDLLQGITDTWEWVKKQ